MSQYDRKSSWLRRPAIVAAVIAGVVGVVGCTASPTTKPAVSETPGILRPSAPEGELSTTLQSQLQAALDDTMAEYDVPGAAVGVWIPGEGTWTAAAGLADIENDEPVDLDMMWPLRSVTKSYTVTLLLQLVDEGEVSLDDTIGQYVDGVTAGDEITLRELAEMSSGNADYTNDDFLAAFTADPETIFTLDQLNGFMLGTPAQFAPGTEKVYTNANTNLLGAVIEEVTGQGFAEVLDERILAPLGQNDTRYIVDAADWTEPHAVGYAPEGDSLASQPRNLSIFGPAGSMITTLDDARVWGQALATGTFLQPETQAERQDGAPLDVGPPYGMYALGIGETDGWWGHNGEGLGFTAAVFHHPDSGATVVAFMNESNLANKAHPADQMFRRVAKILTTGAEQ
ncbi:serine hydrolase domain-containing protein [Microbacterium murale]|uniref:D-alanyl-D-alanine carboxypeptidase n=1 Tax=Microbacterium murale TaxID=1081040 RepID=A0ABU0P7Y9_9MICO|nr:serine hydrolase domain-containing protein [Microbacterium murale]MDQ0643460.1 D-alanyl-D-alanine carboxypeptidase [Microbacterium murale]